MLGAQLLRGQRGEGMEPLPGWGGEKRLQPSRPQRPEVACGWVGKQVGPGEVKGTDLSCSLKIGARSQCGCATRTFPGGGGRGQEAWSQENRTCRASALDQRIQTPLPPSGRKPQPWPRG